MDVKKNITIANLNELSSGLFLNLEKEKRVAKHFVNDLKISTSSINKEVQYLSGGNQQKVVLAKWLFVDADLFIFDEPTKGVDIGAKQEIYEIINSLSKKNKAIIVISSELEEIIHISDRVLVMNSGEIIADLEGEDINKKNILDYAIRDIKKN